MKPLLFALNLSTASESHSSTPPFTPPSEPVAHHHQQMASASFRDSMNSLGWSRRDPDMPVSTNSSTPILSRLQSLNPFGGGGYVRLPTHDGPGGAGAPLPAPTRREEEEGWLARKFRIFNSVNRLAAQMRDIAAQVESMNDCDRVPVPAFLSSPCMCLAAAASPPQVLSLALHLRL